MRRLIVNADDFGLTGGINRAVVDLNAAGALTSATLMAASPHFSEAVSLTRKQPSLGMGCHIVLLDGSPVADPESVPTLLNAASYRSGESFFRPTLGQFVRDLSLGRIGLQDIEREATAQIIRMQQAGVVVTHIDTHKHTHMFPTVLDAVTRAASACGIHAIRNPFEPEWSIVATPDSTLIRRSQVRFLRIFHKNFLRLIHKRKFTTTDGCLGVVATGTLDNRALRSIVNRLPEGTWELVCHPAYVDDELRVTPTRLKESRAVELAALQSLPGILTGLSDHVEQIHFGQLP